MTVMDDQTLDNAVNAETPDAFRHSDDRCRWSYHMEGLVSDDCTPNYGGWKADGTPRRKPGPSKGTRVGAAIPRPTRTGGPKPRASKQKTGTDYRPGILGMLQIPAFALGAAGQLNESLALDGAALSMHAPGIAEALNDLANDNPAVAAALDRILSAGPYGAIIGACLPLAFQIAANHKKIPDAMAKSCGALPADEFRAALIAQSGVQG